MMSLAWVREDRPGDDIIGPPRTEGRHAELTFLTTPSGGQVWYLRIKPGSPLAGRHRRLIHDTGAWAAPQAEGQGLCSGTGNWERRPR